MSNFHKNNLSLELLFSSIIKPQPEAGALIVKNSYRSRSILRIWYEMTAINFEELSETEISRHDQETLFLLSNIYKSLQYESWLRYKIFKYGLRKYIKFEYLRR